MVFVACMKLVFAVVSVSDRFFQKIPEHTKASESTRKLFAVGLVGIFASAFSDIDKGGRVSVFSEYCFNSSSFLSCSFL